MSQFAPECCVADLTEIRKTKSCFFQLCFQSSAHMGLSRVNGPPRWWHVDNDYWTLKRAQRKVQRSFQSRAAHEFQCSAFGCKLQVDLQYNFEPSLLKTDTVSKRIETNRMTVIYSRSRLDWNIETCTSSATPHKSQVMREAACGSRELSDLSPYLCDEASRKRVFGFMDFGDSKLMCKWLKGQIALIYYIGHSSKQFRKARWWSQNTLKSKVLWTWIPFLLIQYLYHIATVHSIIKILKYTKILYIPIYLSFKACPCISIHGSLLSCLSATLRVVFVLQWLSLQPSNWSSNRVFCPFQPGPSLLVGMHT